jgi:hypothetical protein
MENGSNRGNTLRRVHWAHERYALKPSSTQHTLQDRYLTVAVIRQSLPTARRSRISSSILSSSVSKPGR